MKFLRWRDWRRRSLVCGRGSRRRRLLGEYFVCTRGRECKIADRK
jgi:hypothetical protein